MNAPARKLDFNPFAARGLRREVVMYLCRKRIAASQELRPRR